MSNLLIKNAKSYEIKGRPLLRLANKCVDFDLFEDKSILIEMTLYHFISPARLLREIYPLEGTMRNLARKHECELVFHNAKIITGSEDLLFRRKDIVSDGGNCVAAVLVSDDSKKLQKVAEMIYSQFGVEELRSRVSHRVLIAS